MEYVSKVAVELQKFADECTETIARMQKEAQARIAPSLQAFIKENPEIVAIKWEQYTPYFNDGEECVFSVNDPGFRFVGDDDWEELWFSRSAERLMARGISKQAIEAAGQFSRAIERIDSTAMKAAFGDHVRVIVTAKGVDVESYEHD